MHEILTTKRSEDWIWRERESAALAPPIEQFDRKTSHNYLLQLFSANQTFATRSMPPFTIQMEASESSKSLSSRHDGVSLSDPSQSNNTNGRSDGSTSNGSFTKHETKVVNRTKVLVYISLLLAGGAISVAAYFFAKNKEQSDFEAEVGESISVISKGANHLRRISESPLTSHLAPVSQFSGWNHRCIRNECREHNGSSS